MLGIEIFIKEEVMTISFFAKLFLLGAVLVMVGCASGKPAREVARLTLKQVVNNGEQVDLKIKAEQKYYKDKVSSFQDAIKADRKVREKDFVFRGAQDFQSLVILSKKPISNKQLRDEIDKVLSKIKQMHTEQDQLLINYKSDFLSSLEKLEYDKKTLKGLRRNLSKLQAKPRDLARLKELFEFGENVKEEYDKLEKEK